MIHRSGRLPHDGAGYYRQLQTQIINSFSVLAYNHLNNTFENMFSCCLPCAWTSNKPRCQYFLTGLLLFQTQAVDMQIVTASVPSLIIILPAPAESHSGQRTAHLSYNRLQGWFSVIDHQFMVFVRFFLPCASQPFLIIL